MGLLDYFRQENSRSAAVAKERLQIVVSHERLRRNQPDYLPALQQDILDVIAKYMPIDPSEMSIQLEQDEHRSILELNICLPKS